jgi:hypothetical protein
MLNDYDLQIDGLQEYVWVTGNTIDAMYLFRWRNSTPLRSRSRGIIVHEPAEQESLLHGICAFDSDLPFYIATI